MLYLDPTTLESEPLLLTALRDNDYSVRVMDHIAGRIITRQVSGASEVWLWTVTGPYLPLHLQPSSGESDGIDEAKRAFREKFDAWLAWASELAHPVAWLE